MRGQSSVPRWQVAATVTSLAVLSAGPLRAEVTEHTFVVSADETDPQKAARGFLNPSFITIPASGPASLYPSSITVDNVPGYVWDVELQIRGLSHSLPDDLDFMLVSPLGTRVVFMSDAGGSAPVSNLRVRIQDEFFNPAAPFIPDDTPITGPPDPLFRPRNWGGLDDTFPPPAPQAGALYTTTSAFKGENPNGEWKLYVVDDSPLNAGSIFGGWLLVLRTTDTNVVTAIPGSGDAGPAAPYPNAFDMPVNLRGRIKKLRVRLHALTHTFPDDLDMLLQGPGGQTVLLMSDAGHSVDVNTINLTFDDAAPRFPTCSVIQSGIYRPTNHEGVIPDTFPAPAPAPPYGTALSVFNNTLPAGTWRLWVVDDSGGDVGSLSNWTLEIQTVDKGDFDQDNLTDLLWRHDGSGRERVLVHGRQHPPGRRVHEPAPLADVRWTDGGHRRLQRGRQERHPLAAHHRRRRT